MKSFDIFTATSLASTALCCASMAWAGNAPGLMEFTIPGDRPMQAHVLYPTDDTGAAKPFGGNAVWQTYDVQPDAAPTGADLPLVVLSHGMFGHRYNQTWLGTELAKAGYIVVAVNHPGGNAFDANPEMAGKLWHRPEDVSRVLDHMLADPVWGEHIDADALFAAGHSLGGFTVLAAAGARYNVGQMQGYCDRDGAAIACNAFTKLGVDPANAEMLNADMSEPRLKAVVSLDPGGTFGFTPDSLAALETPVLMISGARTPEVLDQDREANWVEEVANPEALNHISVAEAGHFDFMGLCTEKGLEFLKAEVPDDVMVCEHGRDTRAQIHAEAVAAVLDFFAAQ